MPIDWRMVILMQNRMFINNKQIGKINGLMLNKMKSCRMMIKGDFGIQIMNNNIYFRVLLIDYHFNDILF